jgi:hypothetical protein
MRSRLSWVIVVMLAVVMLAAGAVSAQESQYIPAIVSFSADADSVSLAEIESGEATVTLSWYIINVTPGQTVQVEYWRANGWVPAWLTREAVQPVGEREVALQDTQSFAPPTFRLTLLDSRGVIDQRFLTIPLSEPMADAAITSFVSTASSVDRDAVERGRARIEVSWSVSNRPADGQLVFEQVLPDGSAVNAELPRSVYYVPSSGVGAVQPRLPQGEQFIRLRLSLVSVISGDVYASADLAVPFTGTTLPAVLPPGPTPTTAAPVQATPAVQPAGPTATPAAAVGPTIQVFSVTPATAAPGSSVTMTWNVLGAVTVQISEVLPNATGLTYVQLPPSGSVNVPLPEAATTQVTYILTAMDAAGNESTAQQIVTIGS